MSSFSKYQKYIKNILIKNNTNNDETSLDLNIYHYLFENDLNMKRILLESHNVSSMIDNFITIIYKGLELTSTIDSYEDDFVSKLEQQDFDMNQVYVCMYIKNQDDFNSSYTFNLNDDILLDDIIKEMFSNLNDIEIKNHSDEETAFILNRLNLKQNIIPSYMTLKLPEYFNITRQHVFAGYFEEGQFLDLCMNNYVIRVTKRNSVSLYNENTDELIESYSSITELLRDNNVELIHFKDFVHTKLSEKGFIIKDKTYFDFDVIELIQSHKEYYFNSINGDIYELEDFINNIKNIMESIKKMEYKFISYPF